MLDYLIKYFLGAECICVFVCQLGVGRAEKLGLHVQPLAGGCFDRMAV